MAACRTKQNKKTPLSPLLRRFQSFGDFHPGGCNEDNKKNDPRKNSDIITQTTLIIIAGKTHNCFEDHFDMIKLRVFIYTF